jgi:hypothetical protein
MLPFASVVTAGACMALALATATPQVPTPAAPPAQGAPTAAAPTAPPASLPAPDADFVQRVDRMLSAAWLADLYPFTRDADITDEGYQAALSMALRCARLAPDRRAAWDLALLLADQVEAGNPEPARAARREALEALSRLDPADDAVRLARLADAIDAHPTADARVRAYEAALSDRNRAAIGSPCAARLAYQLASLESRIGNPELFARWLAESVKTDPAFPAAAQAAAGFFRMRVSDPAADVELLAGAVEANPRDVATWSALVTVLLDGAAFSGAERAIRMAIAVAEAERRSETVYSLTGDLATALWGSGQTEAAMRELELRMARLTDDFRRMISLIDPSITNERLNREFPPIPTTLSIAMLGLAKRQGDPAKVEQLAERALRGSDAEIRRAKDANASPRRIAEYDIQKIAVTLLFGKDVAPVRGLIDSTAKAEALGAQGKARFEGMLLWRQGKPAEAVAALEPLRAEDPMARYAYASALLELKRQADAANEFRAVAQDYPGTSIGLLALDRLAEALGQKALATSQLSPEIAARAKAMEESLKRHLPKSVDDLVEHPLRAITVEVQASSTTIRPYEPLDLKVKIRNSSRLPLAIGGDAPISGKVTLRAAAPRPGVARYGELEPQPVLIDRRLRLDPGQEIEVPVEAALTQVGLLLNFEPLDPHLVNIAVVSNPASATGGAGPGFMGTVTSAPPIQYTGVLVTKAWIEESRQAIKAAGSVEAVTRLALLAHAAAAPEKHPEPVRPLLKESWPDIVGAWKAMPERAQAWVIGVLPKETPDLAPLLEAARSSTSPSVLRSWAITRVTDPKDAMLDVCRRSGDAELAQLADAISWTMERRAARAVEEVGIEAEKAMKATPPPPTGGQR